MAGLLRIRPRLVVWMAGSALVALVPLAPGLDRPARGQHPSQTHADGKHFDLFRSAKPETTHLDWDPRFRPEVRYSPMGDQAIIQGDIVIGKLSEIRRRKLYSWSAEARQINLDDPALGLTKEQKAVLQGLRGMPVPDDLAEASRRRQRSQALRIIEELIRSGGVGKDAAGFPAEAVEAYKKAQGADGAAMASVTQVGAKYRWPEGVIPYRIDDSLPNQSLIVSAIDHWHSRTDRIHLRPATDGDVDYVRFVLGDGCSSPIGRMGGEQYITLTAGCEAPQIIHEIGHTIGLWHEQCRNDRDSYLIIHDENVDPEKLHNFDLAGVEGQDVGPFDFGSIMLYPTWAFSDNGKPSMESRFPNVGEFGVGSPNIIGLSPGDVAGVRRMYFRPARPPNPRHAGQVPGNGTMATPRTPARRIPIPNLRDRTPRVPPPIPAPAR
jgi:hypothetical protein